MAARRTVELLPRPRSRRSPPLASQHCELAASGVTTMHALASTPAGETTLVRAGLLHYLTFVPSTIIVHDMYSSIVECTAVYSCIHATSTTYKRTNVKDLLANHQRMLNFGPQPLKSCAHQRGALTCLGSFQQHGHSLPSGMGSRQTMLKLTLEELMITPRFVVPLRLSLMAPVLELTSRYP